MCTLNCSSFDVSLQYKVVVLSGEHEGELFFCTEYGDNDILQGVLLDSGEYSQCKRSDQQIAFAALQQSQTPTSPTMQF